MRLLALARLLLVMGLITGCDLLGPDNPYLVTIENDTETTVVLTVCADEGCRDLNESFAFKPGQRMRTNVSTRGVPTVFLVTEPATDRRLGCLPLVMPEPTEGVVAYISQRIARRPEYDEEKPWPPRDPS